MHRYLGGGIAPVTAFRQDLPQNHRASCDPRVHTHTDSSNPAHSESRGGGSQTAFGIKAPTTVTNAGSNPSGEDYAVRISGMEMFCGHLNTGQGGGPSRAPDGPRNPSGTTRNLGGFHGSKRDNFNLSNLTLLPPKQVFN